MLTAWDKAGGRMLALPDFEARHRLEQVRERARRGEIVCPTCEQLLWLRAGDIRTPHFGHRSLSDCPQGRVSEPVLAARRQLYLFFQVRIGAGKLPGEIELEPRVPAAEPFGSVDLLLRRSEKPAVAVCILEHGLKPDARAGLPEVFSRTGWEFRPVFLSDRLKKIDQASDEYALDPTQREYRLRSPYDLRQGGAAWPGTLHFLDAPAAQWTTLRGLWLAHEPQVYSATAIRNSSMQALLWSEAHSDWVHPGEAELLKALRHAQAEKIRKEKEAELARIQRAREEEARQRRQAELARAAREAARPPEEEDDSELEEPVAETRARSALPDWIIAGLVCIGCARKTTDWQNADPSQGRCVCKSCFGKGVRLS